MSLGTTLGGARPEPVDRREVEFRTPGRRPRPAAGVAGLFVPLDPLGSGGLRDRPSGAVLGECLADDLRALPQPVVDDIETACEECGLGLP